SWTLSADASEAVEHVIVARVPVPELVQPRIVEAQRSAGSVHLDEEVTRPTGARAGHLERSAWSVRKAHQHRRRLVDVNRTTAPLGREGLRLRSDVHDLSNHPECKVDQVSAEIGDRRRSHRALETPVEGNVRIEELV